MVHGKNGVWVWTGRGGRRRELVWGEDRIWVWAGRNRWSLSGRQGFQVGGVWGGLGLLSSGVGRPGMAFAWGVFAF